MAKTQKTRGKKPRQQKPAGTTRSNTKGQPVNEICRSEVKELSVQYAAKWKGSAKGKGMNEEEGAILVKFGRPSFSISPFEKMDMIEKGISKKALENLKEKAAMDYDQLAKVLNVARATLISKKGNEKFNADVSDKILGLADIYSYGYEVFGDQDRFNQWIFRANMALGGQAPFDILNTSFGREEIKNLIGRIDYGVYS